VANVLNFFDTFFYVFDVFKYIFSGTFLGYIVAQACWRKKATSFSHAVPAPHSRHSVVRLPNHFGSHQKDRLKLGYLQSSMTESSKVALFGHAKRLTEDTAYSIIWRPLCIG